MMELALYEESSVLVSELTGDWAFLRLYPLINKTGMINRAILFIFCVSRDFFNLKMVVDLCQHIIQET